MSSTSKAPGLHTVSASTYLAYKQDTNAFVTWLGATAKKHGWTQSKKTTRTNVKKCSKTAAPPPAAIPDPTRSPKLKSNGRKQSKATAAITKYTVSTDDLLKQMAVVSEASQGVIMPRAVCNALQRAIRARQKFSMWYRTTGCGTEDALEGHAHFIAVLQKALELFQRGEDGAGASAVGLDAWKPTEKADVFMTNMFEALELEDVVDKEGDYLMEESTHNPADAASYLESYQLQEKAADIDFAIYALFEDIHRIRAETKKIFRRLAAGDISLVHATLVVAAALQLVRQADAEVHDLFCSVGYKYTAEFLHGGTFFAYVCEIYSSAALGRANEQLSMVNFGPFDEFVFLPLGYTLQRIRDTAHCAWRRLDPAGLIPGIFPMLPMRLFYVDAADHKYLNDPRVQKGEADDHFICQLYRDMLVLEGLKEGLFDHSLATLKDFPRDKGGSVRPSMKEFMLESTLPYFDVLHEAMRPVWKQRRIDLHSVFAAQALVDMHDICGSTITGTTLQVRQAQPYAEGFKALSKLDDLRASYAEDLVSRNYSLLRRTIVAEPRWLLVKKATLLDVKEIREGLVREARTDENIESNKSRIPDGWEPSKADWLDDPWAVNITGIWPNESLSFYMDKNLLYGGTALLDLVASSEEAAVAVANENMSIMCMAQIYNAARQLGLLEVQWLELDRVIERQAAALFANDIPKTPQAMFARFEYRLGIRLSKARSIIAIDYPGTDAPWKMKPSQAATMIRQTLDGQTTLPRLLSWLDSQSPFQKVQSSGAASKPKDMPSVSPVTASQVTDADVAAALVPTTDSHRQLSLRQTLQRIETNLDAVLPDIDYFALTQSCQHHLTKLRGELAAKFEMKWPYCGERATGYGSRIKVTLSILQENRRQAEAYEAAQRRVRKKKRKEGKAADVREEVVVKPIGRQLEYAARYLTKMLAKNNARN